MISGIICKSMCITVQEMVPAETMRKMKTFDSAQRGLGLIRFWCPISEPSSRGVVQHLSPSVIAEAPARGV